MYKWGPTLSSFPDLSNPPILHKEIQELLRIIPANCHGSHHTQSGVLPIVPASDSLRSNQYRHMYVYHPFRRDFALNADSVLL